MPDSRSHSSVSHRNSDWTLRHYTNSWSSAATFLLVNMEKRHRKILSPFWAMCHISRANVTSSKTIETRYDRMTNAYAEVRQALRRSAERNKRYYECKVPHQKYSVGLQPTKVSRETDEIDTPWAIPSYSDTITSDNGDSEKPKAKPLFFILIRSSRTWQRRQSHAWLSRIWSIPTNNITTRLLNTSLKPWIPKTLHYQRQDNTTREDSDTDGDSNCNFPRWLVIESNDSDQPLTNHSPDSHHSFWGWRWMLRSVRWSL